MLKLFGAQNESEKDDSLNKWKYETIKYCQILSSVSTFFGAYKVCSFFNLFSLEFNFINAKYIDSIFLGLTFIFALSITAVLTYTNIKIINTPLDKFKASSNPSSNPSDSSSNEEKNAMSESFKGIKSKTENQSKDYAMLAIAGIFSIGLSFALSVIGFNEGIKVYIANKTLGKYENIEDVNRAIESTRSSLGIFDSNFICKDSIKSNKNRMDEFGKNNRTLNQLRGTRERLISDKKNIESYKFDEIAQTDLKIKKTGEKMDSIQTVLTKIDTSSFKSIENKEKLVNEVKRGFDNLSSLGSKVTKPEVNSILQEINGNLKKLDVNNYLDDGFAESIFTQQKYNSEMEEAPSFLVKSIYCFFAYLFAIFCDIVPVIISVSIFPSQLIYTEFRGAISQFHKLADYFSKVALMPNVYGMINGFLFGNKSFPESIAYYIYCLFIKFDSVRFKDRNDEKNKDFENIDQPKEIESDKTDELNSQIDDNFKVEIKHKYLYYFILIISYIITFCVVLLISIKLVQWFGSCLKHLISG